VRNVTGFNTRKKSESNRRSATYFLLQLAKDPAEGIVAGSAIDFETLFKETTMKKYLDYWELWRAKASNS